MRRRSWSTHSPRAGMSLVEVMISLAIFATTMMAFAASLRATQDVEDTIRATDRVNREAMRALRLLRENIARSGFETDYPVVLDAVELGEDFPDLAHATPLGEDGDALENCDFVFRHPEDADGDGWPDVIDGEPIWTVAPAAFLVMPDIDGRNQLVLVDADGIRRTICRDLVDVRFETASMAGFAIPLDCVRVTLTLAASVSNGPDVVAEHSMVVALKNGGFEE